MIPDDNPAVAEALAAYLTSVDALEAALNEDVAHDVDAVVAELLDLAADWQSLSDQMGEEADDIASEGQTLPANLQARAEQVSQVVHTALDDVGDVVDLARGLHDHFGTTRDELSEVLESVTAASAKALNLGERLLDPASNLGVEIPRALSASREHLIAQVNAAAETISTECIEPANQGVADLVETFGQIVDAVGTALDTNHDDLESRSQHIVSSASHRSLGELQNVGGTVIEIVSNIKDTGHAVGEIVNTVGQAKHQLVDGIRLTNSGVQLVIDILEELDQLFSDA